MIEFFYPNKDGEVVFTKEQLEKLLKRVYNQGHSDGYFIGSANRGYWYWNYPQPNYTGDKIEITCGEGCLNSSASCETADSIKLENSCNFTEKFAELIKECLDNV